MDKLKDKKVVITIVSIFGLVLLLLAIGLVVIFLQKDLSNKDSSAFVNRAPGINKPCMPGEKRCSTTNRLVVEVCNKNGIGYTQQWCPGNLVCSNGKCVSDMPITPTVKPRPTNTPIPTTHRPTPTNTPRVTNTPIVNNTVRVTLRPTSTPKVIRKVPTPTTIRIVKPTF